jgi:hydrogenase maturation protease
MVLPRPVRIVGIGSPNGDDAVAWEVIRRLREQGLARGDVTLHALDGGQRLLDVLDGHGSLVLIDAVSGSGRPGSIHHLKWPDHRLEVQRPRSTHGLGLAEALRLATTLGLLPPCVVIFAIELVGCGAGQGMTPAVASAVPEVARQIVERFEESDHA